MLPLNSFNTTKTIRIPLSTSLYTSLTASNPCINLFYRTNEKEVWLLHSISRAHGETSFSSFGLSKTLDYQRKMYYMISPKINKIITQAVNGVSQAPHQWASKLDRESKYQIQYTIWSKSNFIRNREKNTKNKIQWRS